MKKIITIVLLAIIVIAGFLIFKNRDEVARITVSKPVDTSVQQSQVQIDNWSTYNHTNGLQFVYPSDFTIEASTGYPERIDFDSRLVKLGSIFELVVYDTLRSKITSLDTIPRLTRNENTQEVLSTNNVTNPNSVPVQIVKGIQYSIKSGKIDTSHRSDMLSIVFLKGKNAYNINWICWANQACFNDDIINKLVNSIKFIK